MDIRAAITAPMITPGILLGTTGTSSVIQSINESMGSTNFFEQIRDQYAAVHNHFITNIVEPVVRVTNTLYNTINALVNPDVYRALTTFPDFRSIPHIMELPIIMHPPVRRLLEEGRIYGFGYDPERLPDEDVYGRLINNGSVDDVAAAMDKNGCVTFEWEWHSTDPKLSFDELDLIADTRATIDKLLATTDYDPTDYPNYRT